jgi:predicted phage tail protein
MLTKIKLYGDLADFIGYKELEAVVNSSADVIRFLICNFPKVEAYLSDKYYKVLVNNTSITKEQIHDPTGKSEISIVPIIVGSGGEETGGIILGAALVGIAIASGGAGVVGLSFAPTGGALASPLAAHLGNIGVGLLLMGVSNLLFPQEKPEDFENDQDPRISFSFSGVQNTSRAGTSIPIVYGECITGSVVISAGTDTDQVHA